MSKADRSGARYHKPLSRCYRIVNLVVCFATRFRTITVRSHSLVDPDNSLAQAAAPIGGFLRQPRRIIQWISSWLGALYTSH